jgi:hypothetical protein
MEIKFYWNSSFLGTNHNMTINENKISLGGVVSTENEAKLEAISILKNEYDMLIKEDEIEFEWGGYL